MATASDEGERICPLCTEEMDLTDQQLKPCKCGYEICVWCWHHIMDMAEKDDTEGRCPACRTPYDKEKIVGMAIDCERIVAEMNSERRLKSQKTKSKASEGRKHLSSVRVIQRNLVYVIGLPANLADEATLERKEYFGQYGKVQKVSITRSSGGAQHPSNTNTCSVYITYAKEEEAVRCIQSVHGFTLEGKSLRACFGTTKYCHTWLRHMVCNNPDCLYLHDMGTPEDSFTKDEIISAYTRSRVQQITGAAINSQRRSGNVLPPPADEFCNNSCAPSGKLVVKNASNNPSNHVKVSSNGSSSLGRSSVLPASASWGLRSSSSCRQSTASMACLQGPAIPKNGTLNGSSAFASITASMAVTSNLHNNGGKIALVTKESDLSHLNVRSGQEATKYTGCQTTTDPLAKAFIDPDYAAMIDYSSTLPEYRGIIKSSTSKNLERKQSRDSCIAEVVNGCMTVDETIQSESFRLSSIDIDNHVEKHPDISNHASLVFDYSPTRLDGNPIICTPHYSEGEDLVIESVSLPSRKATMVSESSCVPSEIPDVSSELKKRLLSAPHSVMDDVHLPVDDRRLKLSEAPTYSSLLCHSCDPPKAPHPLSDASQYSETGNLSSLGNADPRTVDTVLPIGGSILSNGYDSILSNGYNTDRFSSSELRCGDDSSGMISNTERFSSDSPKIDSIPDVDLGEISIISDILSLDLDAWDKSSTSPSSLAKLFGETDKQNGSLKLLSSWKPQNNSQSRFSFARQEDPVNQATHLEPSFSSSAHLQKNCFDVQASADHRDPSRDKFCSSLEAAESLIGGLVSPNKSAVSRAQTSAPPGFSVPTKSPPPGFSSQERIDRGFVSASSGNRMLESPLPMKQYQDLSTGNINDNFNDVEFIDPAILAVGKGTLPLATSNLGFDLASTFSAQLNASEHESRLPLLMQQPFSTHQNFGFSDLMANGFSHSNNLYTSPGLAEHIQENYLSSSAQMSLPQAKNSRMMNSQWDGWNEVQSGNKMVLSEILRNERLGFDKYFPGQEELKFHMSSSGDLYNRAFGM